MRDLIKKHKLDIIITVSIITASLLALVLSLVLRKTGNTVEVKIDGETVAEYSLCTDGTYILNGGTNTLVIENGEAFVINSDCPDHTCERTGKIRYVGESVVCLPNRVSVTVKGDGNDGPDFIS